jgi:hypothetical protein
MENNIEQKRKVLWLQNLQWKTRATFYVAALLSNSIKNENCGVQNLLHTESSTEKKKRLLIMTKVRTEDRLNAFKINLVGSNGWASSSNFSLLTVIKKNIWFCKTENQANYKTTIHH